MSGTDTLFYLLDTMGGFVDGKGMLLGGVAKAGAKAARVAPHMGKIGKVSSVLDDTLGMKGLSSLGKLGMHTVGHSASVRHAFSQYEPKWEIDDQEDGSVDISCVRRFVWESATATSQPPPSWGVRYESYFI